MRISKHDPHVTIDGSGDLTITRNPHCLTVDKSVSDVSVKNFRFVSVANKTSRLKRFFTALPHLWEFCK